MSRLICRVANNELRFSIIEPQAPRRRQIKSAPSGSPHGHLTVT